MQLLCFALIACGVLGIALVPLVAVGAALFGRLNARAERIVGRAVLLGFLSMVGGIAALFAVDKIDAAWRKWRVRSIAADAQPLVAALDAYVGRHGSPPATLDQLVPEFIEAVARDKIREHAFQYRPVYSSAQLTENATTYSLSCPCPCMDGCFGSVMYQPLPRGPALEGARDDPRRTGDWVVHHDY